MEENGSVVRENYKKFPYEIINVDEATKKRLMTLFKGPFFTSIKVGPEKWSMPAIYEETADILYNFPAFSDDIYISTYPRSGTTWTQEMIWLLCNDLNYEAAKATPLTTRFPFLEMESLAPKNDAINEEMKNLLPKPALDILSEVTSGRLIKTHLPIKLMPYDALEKRCKIVYVARNPADVVVSLYHFNRNPAMMYAGSFQQFVDLFLEDLPTWSPFFEHIKDGWNRRNESNVLFLFYEDLVVDLEKSLKKLAAFLEKPLKDDDLPELMQHLNIKNFKQNSSVNHEFLAKFATENWEFIRQGGVGSNPEMTPQIMEKIEEWTDRQLSGTDLKFPHKLRHKINLYKMQVSKQ
ncbi:Sulfotransferase 1C4 [Pseudolycoriella hygida]|uniref:Sulfotransferase 1C4 n=1 Tax=Pseudolycoriella hygida TaxID=35572 RepID=A0A9Q0MV92_9DIPT|nr:Sulfotransferase 1C4 [Pseudolycoriella hygida]